MKAVTIQDFGKFMTVLTTLHDNDITVCDWDKDGNIEIQWADPHTGGMEREWLYVTEDIVGTINNIIARKGGAA